MRAAGRSYASRATSSSAQAPAIDASNPASARRGRCAHRRTRRGARPGAGNLDGVRRGEDQLASSGRRRGGSVGTISIKGAITMSSGRSRRAISAANRFRRCAGARQQQGGPGPRGVIVSHWAECYLPPTRLTTHRTSPHEPRRLHPRPGVELRRHGRAVLRGPGEAPEILSSVVIGQADLHAATAASCPRSPRAPMPSAWIRRWRPRLGEAGVGLSRRCDRRDRGAGADRRGAVRRHDGQGAGDGAWQAADRGQPPGRSRADAAPDRRGARFPTCCCWSPAGIARSCASMTGTPSPGSAAPSTTRRGRHSTRSRASWVCRNPAGRRSRRRRAGRSDAVRFPRPLLDRPGATCPFPGSRRPCCAPGTG
jgi:hypothetical protein